MITCLPHLGPDISLSWKETLSKVVKVKTFLGILDYSKSLIKPIKTSRTFPYSDDEFDRL